MAKRKQGARAVGARRRGPARPPADAGEPLEAEPVTPAPTTVEPGSVTSRLFDVARRIRHYIEKVRNGEPLTSAEREVAGRLVAVIDGRPAIDFDRLSDPKLAAAFGFDTRTVQKWHARGLPVNEDGTHSLVRVIAWYVERGGSIAGGKRPVSVEAAERELKEARKKILDLEYGERAGELVRIDAVIGALQRHILEAKTRLKAMIEQVVVLLPRDQRPAGRRAVEKAVSEACQDLADAERAREFTRKKRKRPKATRTSRK